MKGESLKVKIDENVLTIEQNNAGISGKSIKYDNIFDEKANQEKIFNTIIVEKIEQMLDGYNVTVFAYGQTGTGKTYTMQGDIGNPIREGIIPRSIKYILQKLKKPGIESIITISCIEIYNEKIYDLLSTNLKNEIDIKYNGEEDVCGNLTELPVESYEKCQISMNTAINRRRTASTLQNADSR